jgi:hypothetical protein
MRGSDGQYQLPARKASAVKITASKTSVVTKWDFALGIAKALTGLDLHMPRQVERVALSTTWLPMPSWEPGAMPIVPLEPFRRGTRARKRAFALLLFRVFERSPLTSWRNNPLAHFFSNQTWRLKFHTEYESVGMTYLRDPSMEFFARLCLEERISPASREVLGPVV